MGDLQGHSSSCYTGAPCSLYLGHVATHYVELTSNQPIIYLAYPAQLHIKESMRHHPCPQSSCRWRTTYIIKLPTVCTEGELLTLELVCLCQALC